MSLSQGHVAGALGQGATMQSQDTCRTSCVGAASQPNGSVPRPAAPSPPRPGASGQRRPLHCTAEATAVQVRRRAHERWSAPQRGAHECRARCMLRELSHAHDGGRSGAVSALPCRCPAAQAVTRTSSGALRRSSRSRWQCCVAALDGGSRARPRPLWCRRGRWPHCWQLTAPSSSVFALSALGQAIDVWHILIFAARCAPYRHGTAA